MLSGPRLEAYRSLICSGRCPQRQISGERVRLARRRQRPAEDRLDFSSSLIAASKRRAFARERRRYSVSVSDLCFGCDILEAKQKLH
jgi:hypothetical protein